MTRKPISPADGPPVRVVIITLDSHLARVVAAARAALRREIPNLSLVLHACADWDARPEALARAKADIAEADIVIATMLFLDEHIRAIEPALRARREACDAMVVAMSAAEPMKLTKLGALRMDEEPKGPMAWIKKLRGSKEKAASAGAAQLAMLRRLPKILRFIPGKAQDLRVFFLTMLYWLTGSEANAANLVRMLINRYAAGPRKALRGTLTVGAPEEFPDTGVYHPQASPRLSDRPALLPAKPGAKGTVGLLVLRSYILGGDTAHYDGAIAALEARGLRVIPAFASGLDSRPAIERFFMANGLAAVDAVVSLTGFSLVGGPAYNDSAAAQDFLAQLDVPYLAAQPVEFQTLEHWADNAAGLTPVESTIMVAIPEIDGAIAPQIFGGRSDGAGEPCHGCERHCTFESKAGNDNAPHMRACPERVEALAAKVEKLVTLRRSARASRKIGIVLFDFPPNAGAAGSAAFLSVFASLFNTLKALKAAGYRVDVPDSVDVLRARLIEGNASLWGTDANVHARIPADDHVRREPHLNEIESEWGPAPGRQLTDGRSLFILGERFGDVFVGLQPGFGYEGDPMRLLFQQGLAPTHAFSAFYRWLREDFGAHALLHFGTHGALEFMPGKQVGLSGACWPERLIADMPNFYLYAANNPSEGAIAKRRSGATLISYLTPPVAQAGLTKALGELKASLERWRATPPGDPSRDALWELIAAQSSALDLTETDGAALAARIYEIEKTLIPTGLHVVGETMGVEARAELIAAAAIAQGVILPEGTARALAEGADPARLAKLSALAPYKEGLATLARLNSALSRETELDAIIHALDSGFVRPAPGGDLIRTPDILPTGRNLHGFDPFKIPSSFAVSEGAAQAQILLDRHLKDGARLPESVAMVLWGTDNLKSEGGPVAQALALMGARPRRDSYGRLCGAELIPLVEMNRPRIDVVITLSGIFRDLLPLQTKMLAEAAWLAATADEPDDLNFIAKHTRQHMAALRCDLETAALRVFSNADGAYGANVNQLIDAGQWSDGDELADAFEARKGFAYGRNGRPAAQPKLLGEALKRVDIAYQNLDSLELGVTTIDHYVDMLGGVSRAVKRARGEDVPVYLGDQTQGDAKIRTLNEQIALETRTRMLNPRWYEGLLQHGYEGVRQIEAQVTNTMGWSATTGQVDPWVYQKISETYVLDAEMRARIAALNPKASARMANRLIEAHERHFWTPDAATLEALRKAGDELEDRLEGVAVAAE
jgi:magnesium chelatase subunit H